MVLFKHKITCLFLLFTCSLAAQVYPDAKVDHLLKKGITELINQEYISARNTFKTLDEKYSSIPLGKIYSAAVYIAEAYDKVEPFNDAAIRGMLNAAIAQAETLVDKDEDNIWNAYFLALAEGYKAYYDALNNNWLKAISGGLSSVSGFEKCLEADTSFYEAYIALGTYKYWKSRKTEFLNWLPFVDNEKDEGIKYLETAISRSYYNFYLSIYSLQWIYIDNREFTKAVKISEKALKEYPRSRFFKWGYARALQDIDLHKAITIYTQILKSYPPHTNPYNEIFLKHLIAQCHQRLGEKEKALQLCNEILSVNNLSDYEIEKLEDRLDRVKALKRELLANK